MKMPTATQVLGWRRHSLRMYAVLAAIRVLAAFYSLSMIHPDEFFQSQEVMARHVLQHSDPVLHGQLHLPWEFQLPTPNRSVLFPSLVAGLPYWILKFVGVPISGHLLLLIPRLILCGSSFAIDFLLYKSAKALSVRDPMGVVLSFSSSWTTLVFLTRPFSNTFETMLLSLSMATLLCFNPHRRVFFHIFHLQTLLLGSLLAVGFFTRFTFPFFFFPLGLELVRRQDSLLQQQLHKKKDKIPESSSSSHILPRLLQVTAIALQGLFAFLFFSCIFIALDTWYFHGQQQVVPHNLSSLVISPWNNLLYNLQHDNLELHGVHTRITHALVNLPMLFGPLYFAFFVQMARSQKTKSAVVFPLACVVVPLVLISLAPHQEPRFMLPLLVPLHLFAGPLVIHTRMATMLWLVFNIALALFFGLLHQGGVLPLLLTISNNAQLSLPRCQFIETPMVFDRNEPLLFYKTYMPPRFALANALEPWGPNFRVVDLAGGNEEMLSQLEAVSKFKTVLLAAPASVEIDRVVAAWTGGGGASATATKQQVIGSCFPHVSTEDLDLTEPMALLLYRLEKE